ncbi:MAG TPA: PEP-utilizing enzyme, partial [Nitrospiraceae bacterium]
QLWVVQARPITGLPRLILRTNDDCEWSRANFKETLPELPSPLGLSFLERFMDRYIMGSYRRLGCTIPEGVTAVRILNGRPYINMTLFSSLVSQLRGNPSLMTEQMGGEELARKPEVQSLGLGALVRASWVMMSEMRNAVRYGPRWFAEMKEMAAAYRREPIEDDSIKSLAKKLTELETWLDMHEVTFAIAGGVSQCLQALGLVLPRWLGDDWRSLLNAALQGQGTVISAQQIIRLADLVRMARGEPEALRGLTDEKATLKEFRENLKGTAFLRAFHSYLEDFGHRGVGESDIMSPRFVDEPEVLLSIIRTLLSSSTAASSEPLTRQASIRDGALAEIRRRFGWRLHRRAVFAWWYRRLCLFFSLREANRHHLMHYSTAVRTILLQVGELMRERGVFESRQDIFFLTLEEQIDLFQSRVRDWKRLVGARHAERERHASHRVPDTIRYWEEVSQESEASPDRPTETLKGIPISAGSAVGPARLVRSIADWDNVKEGDIIVISVIDPGMTPLFILARGLVAEMGGTLSHGAIIAREYGIPAVVNVIGAMTRIRDGDVLVVDARRGAVLFQRETALLA